MENPSKVIKLDEVKDLVAFQRATCDVKVVDVVGVKEVTGGKRMQEVLICDCSGTVRLTLWENDIGKMEEDRVKGLMVREFRSKKFLSTSKDNCDIEVMDDIGSIEEGEEGEEEDVLFDHKRAIEVNG